MPTLKPDDFYPAIEAGDTAAITNALAADPSLVEARNAGLSPIMVAAYWGRADVLPALIERKGPLEFWEAAIVGDAERLQELVDANPSLVREHSPDGFMGLRFAAFFGKPEAADVLLRAGAVVTIRTTNVFHNQPLHAAVAGSDPRTRIDCAAGLLQAALSQMSGRRGALLSRRRLGMAMTSWWNSWWPTERTPPWSMTRIVRRLIVRQRLGTRVSLRVYENWNALPHSR